MMRSYLGVISKIRNHPTHPVQVEFHLESGTLELDWLMVSMSAWGGVQQKRLKKGVECLVVDTGYQNDPNKYRVTDFFPGGGLILPNNREQPARKGATVKITGVALVGTVEALGILAAVAGLPVPISLSISAEGEVL